MNFQEVDVMYGHVTLPKALCCSSLAHGVATQSEETPPNRVRQVCAHVLGYYLHCLGLRERQEYGKVWMGQV